MNYIGSKLSLLNFLETSITSVVGGKKGVFCDLFAGTGAVGKFFKEKGFSVIANDLQYYSYVLNKNYIENHQVLPFKNLFSEISELEKISEESRAQKVCKFLDSIPEKKGFLYKNYSPEGTKGQEFERMYFSQENAKKCDAIRQKIEEWKTEEKISENEYFFLLTTLLENIDKVANTASVYGAFLKKLKKSAQKIFTMKPANFFLNDHEHQVFNEDINELVQKIEGDILYLDPPYNQRQYAPNYHILETISKYDNPKIKGKTGLRDYSEQKSNFCQKGKVLPAFENLISNAKTKYIFLSYNNEGLMTHEEIKNIMSKYGKYGVFTQKYSRFKADKTDNRNHKANEVLEYLHYIEKK